MGAGSPYVSVNGTQYTYDRAAVTTKVCISSLVIQDREGETPNTCQFTALGFTPTVGQAVIVRLVSAAGTKQFGGVIVSVDDHYLGKPANQAFHVSCIDYTWLLNKRKVIKKYTSQSATAIAQDLISTYCTGFTSTNVAASLATIDEITFTNVDVTEALTRLAKRIGGYWYCDYDKDLHFFLTETGSDPTDLTSSHSSLTDFQATRDLSQVVTRVYVEGGGANLAAPAQVADTFLTLDSTDWYETAGGTVVCGPQRITYTGKRQGRTWDQAWTVRTTPGATIPLHVCWSPRLRLWAGVTTAKVVTSPDGVTWTTISVTSPAWCRICWSPQLNLFCAVANADAGATGKRVMTSPDGVTWTAQTASAANTWSGICWSPTLGIFVAVAASGTNRVMTSPDGVTWTGRAASAEAAADTWVAVDWSPSLGLFAATGSTTVNAAVMTSPTGTGAWTTQTCPLGPQAICWSPELAIFCAMGDTIQTSLNGTTWTARTAANGNAWRDVAWAKELGLFFACSNLNSASTNNIQTSPDGSTWTAWASATTGTWRQLGYSPDLGQICVVQSAVSGGPIQTTESLPFSQLTGVPASGAGSILYAVKNGEPVNLLVTVNDASAQTALGTLLGGGADGIQEEYIQDNRLSKTEATARGTAVLALRSTTQVTIRYRVRDVLTRSGRNIHVNLPAPQSLTGDFKIQQVTIDHFPEVQGQALLPTYTVQASSSLFSLEDLLRMVRPMAA